MSDYPIVNGLMRSGTVQYRVELARASKRDPAFTERPEDVGRLVAMALAAFQFTCEVRASFDETVLFVYVPADVTIEAIDARAAKVVSDWEATLG